MLRESAIREAIQLATSAEAKGLRIAPIGKTPLAVLVDKSMVGSQEAIIGHEAKGVYEPDVGFIQARSGSFGAALRGDIDGHSRELDNFRTDVAKAVTSHMRYARSVAAPVILEAINTFVKSLEAYHIDPASHLEVVFYDLPSILYDASTLSSIKKFAGTPLGKVSSIRMPDISEEDLMAAVNTSDDVATWLATVGAGLLTKVWQDVFQNAAEQAAELARNLQDINEQAAAFLLAQAYLDNPPKGVGTSLANYNSALAMIRDQAASGLSYASDQMESYQKTGMVIRSYTDRQIVVVKPVFDAWEYSTPQSLIIAACMLSNPPRYVKELTDQAPQLIRAWEAHVAAVNSTTEQNRFVVSKEVLETTLVQVVAANKERIYGPLVTGDIKTISLESIPEHLEFHRRFKAILPQLSGNDFKDINELMTCVVGRCVFYFSSAYEILSGINQAMKENPRLSPAEAATLARVKYVADYVFDQVVVTGL